MLSVFYILSYNSNRASSIYDLPRFMLVMSIGLFIEAIGLIGFAISTGLYLGNLFN